MSTDVERSNSVIEFTTRAIIAGIGFGILFGAANAYLGLRVGLTVSTSIPIAVLTVALLKVIARRNEDVILEANLSQTIGSASSSLATGTIFTIPALFLWGLAPPFWQVSILALLGGCLGIAAMIPLRRLLIVRSADELPYPEGTACAEVLRATTTASSGGKWIFIGLAAGAAVKLLIGGLVLIPSTLSMHLPLLAKADIALEIAPALLAVGYILGYKQSSIMVSGSLISAIVRAGNRPRTQLLQRALLVDDRSQRERRIELVAKVQLVAVRPHLELLIQRHRAHFLRQLVLRFDP